MIPTFDVTINGRRHTVTAAADTPLLWVLRDSLGLTGAKYGCGVGECSACTVLIDGEPVLACQTVISEVGAHAIITIEGQAGNELSAVQRAWLDEDVAQCGYCQPGMILRATALLRAHPQPTDAQIDQAFEGAVCRCGTFARMRKAIVRAAGGPAR